MTVKDLWVACANWEHDTRVLIYTADEQDPLGYDDIYEVMCLYDALDVEEFWILKDGAIAILLKDEPLPF